MTSPRVFRLQPLSVLYRTGRLQPQALQAQLRHAHIKGAPPPRPPPSKPRAITEEDAGVDQRVLEKPDRYRKPSHPARLPRRSSLAGPPLSEAEIQAQKTKQYPHMMPPEGTRLHWFLTNRRIHLFITLGVLSFIGSWMYIEGLRRSLSPTEKELLPSTSLLPWHPFRYVRQFIEVWRLQTARISQEVDERRQATVADAQKRAAYRKAHGIEVQSIPNMLGFKGEKQGETGIVPISASGAIATTAQQGADLRAMEEARERKEADKAQAVETEDVYNDLEGKRPKRRWAPFGITLW